MTTTSHRVQLPAATAASLCALPVDDRAALGAAGEELAAGHLTACLGARVLARNQRIVIGELRGELDLVVHDPLSDTLIACEVKTRRRAQAFDGAVAGLGHRQQRRLRSLLLGYRHLCGGPQHAPRSLRIDVIAIDLTPRPQLLHLAGI